MRRLVIALSLSTLVFAASTAYLARALYQERASSETARLAADTSIASHPVFAQNDPVAAAPQATRATSTPEQAAAGAASASVVESSPPQAVTHVVSHASPDPAKLLAQLTDPAQRIQMLDERKSMMRMTHPGLADYLKMDEAEFERFLDTLARQDLDRQESGLRCYIDKNCGKLRLDRNLMQDQQRELADLFGAQTVDAFTYFQYSQNQRQAVQSLRAQLPDKYRLLDSQSEALISALYEEQQRINQDQGQRRVQVTSFNGVIFAPAFEPGQEADPATVQAADDYNRRMRDRAATILTPEQLAAYERMQRDAMQSFQSMMVRSRSVGVLRQGD